MRPAVAVMRATRPGSEAANRIVARIAAVTIARAQALPSAPPTAWTRTSKEYSSVRPYASVPRRVTRYAPGSENVWVAGGPPRVATTAPAASVTVHVQVAISPVDPRPSSATGTPARASGTAAAQAIGGGATISVVNRIWAALPGH